MSPLSTVRLNGFLQTIIEWCSFYNAQTIIDMVECAVTCISIITGLIWYATSMASLRIRITYDICLLTATLMDEENPSSDTLLLDNLSNSQGTFVEGRRVHF